MTTNIDSNAITEASDLLALALVDFLPVLRDAKATLDAYYDMMEGRCLSEDERMAADDAIGAESLWAMMALVARFVENDEGILSPSGAEKHARSMPSLFGFMLDEDTPAA